MPPGVTTNMIPGNRPEDAAEEAFWELLATKLDEAKITAIALDKPAPSANSVSVDDLWDTTEFVKIIQIARDIGHQMGYYEGQNEQSMADAYFEMEIDEVMRDWLEEHPQAFAKAYLAKLGQVVSDMKRRNRD